VEAYYGDEIRPGFFERDLVDPQRQDSRDGKLVVVSELKRYFGHLTSADLMEFKRNNRSSRRDLRRHASAASRERELRQLIEEEAEAEYREAADEAADALVDIATWAQTPSSTSPSKRT
jgi:peptide subunit release factor 1 (eRF1)